MILKIANNAALDKWLDERRQADHDLVSVKGKAPHGATYSDGTLIEHPVNVAWKDVITGELFAIEYEVKPCLSAMSSLRHTKLHSRKKGLKV